MSSPLETEFEQRRADWEAEHYGLLDPGQPTVSATIDHARRMEAPFTATERRLIRADLENQIDE